MHDLYMRGVGERSALALARGARARGRTRGAHIEILEQRTLLSVSIINGGGLGYAGRGGGGPPDVTGAAGPSSYLEIDNSTVALFSPKPGGAVIAQDGINDFFFNSAIGNESLIYNQTVNIAANGATESGTTVTITTTTPHGFVAGDGVTISGVGVAGYNGGFTITGTPTPTTFTYTAGTSGLAASGGGTANSQSCGTCDSTGVFDELMGVGGRFIIGEIDIDNFQNVGQYIFAVSKSNSPTAFDAANWNFYHITTTEGSGGPSSTSWSDYPGNPGYNADAFVETFNMFGGGPTGTQVVTVNASDMANGVSQGSLRFFKNDVPGGKQNYRPATMHDAAPGDPMWLVHNDDTGNSISVVKMTNMLSNSASFDGSSSNPGTQLSLPAADNFVVSGGIANPLNPDNTAAIDGDDDAGDFAENPGGGGAFDPGSRILKAAEYNNTIVAAHTVDVGSATSSLASAQPNDKNGNPLGGTGYTVGDILTVTGGTFTTAAKLKVQSVNGSGTITAVTVSTAGSYSSLSGITGGASGGTGSGAKFSLFFTGQLAAQWYAIDVSGGTPAFQQVGGSPNVGRAAFGPNTYCYEPGIDINSSGEIGLGFMESDTTGGAANAATGGFISTFVTARKPTDLAGTMQPVVLVPAGTGSAPITGRIGDFSGMSLDPSNGTFWHVNEFGGGGPTDIANFTPEDKPVVTAPSDQTAVEGAPKAIDLGSFADADGSPWTVKVAWGDGSTESFTTSTAGPLGTRTHTYAEEGSDVVTVTVTDNTLLSDSKTFNVSVSDPAVVTSSAPVNAVEGQDTGSVAVATFIDPGGPEALSDYSATINWGDGTAPSTGTITLSSGTYTVSGNHTYAEESAPDHPGSNPYAIVVTIKHDAAPDATANTTATVADPAVAATGGFNFTAVEGVPSATQTVATFTDPGGAETVGDYSALINWGDGTVPTPGTITLSGGVYTVQGNHTYAVGLGQPDDFGNSFCDANAPHYNKPITVTISHENAPQSVAHSSATISLPPDSAHLAGGSLIVVGTTGDDQVLINPVGNSGAVRVFVNSGNLGTFTLAANGRIIVAAMAGDDDIQVAGGVRIPSVLYGGPGNDRIKGGGGAAIEVGCDGNDFLIGGNSGDLLIGGDGNDRIVAGQGADILVAANIVDPALNEDTKFSDLVNVLNGGPVHALDDGSADTLTGGGGADTFYYHFLGTGPFDRVTGNGGTSINI